MHFGHIGFLQTRHWRVVIWPACLKHICGAWLGTAAAEAGADAASAGAAAGGAACPATLNDGAATRGGVGTRGPGAAAVLPTAPAAGATATATATGAGAKTRTPGGG